MRTPDSELHELLLSLFNSEELRIWADYNEKLSGISTSLPGKESTPQNLVAAFIAILKRRGLVDAEFFRELIETRNDRAEDINRVAVVWSRNRNSPKRASAVHNPNRVQLKHEQPDILVITALPEELRALLSIQQGVLKRWTQDEDDSEIHRAVLDGRAGPIRVAATRLTRMGGVATASTTSRLITQLKPRALAMCGVCAGHVKKTALGDVVIADRLFQHDEGKVTHAGHLGDLTVDSIRDGWLRAAQNLEGPATGLFGYSDVEGESWKWWLLEHLQAKREPLSSAAFKRYFPDSVRASRLQYLFDEGLIALQGKHLLLTPNGENRLNQYQLLHATEVRKLPFHIHIGPMGSGNAVHASDVIWTRLTAGGMRKVLAVEMEAAAIGRVAHEHSIPFALAKGVMDHADSYKTDRYKRFAARASAEVLCFYLRTLDLHTSHSEVNRSVDLPRPSISKNISPTTTLIIVNEELSLRKPLKTRITTTFGRIQLAIESAILGTSSSQYSARIGFRFTFSLSYNGVLLDVNKTVGEADLRDGTTVNLCMTVEPYAGSRKWQKRELAFSPDAAGVSMAFIDIASRVSDENFQLGDVI